MISINQEKTIFSPIQYCLGQWHESIDLILNGLGEMFLQLDHSHLDHEGGKKKIKILRSKSTKNLIFLKPQNVSGLTDRQKYSISVYFHR